MTTGALAQLSFLAFYLRIFPNRGINLATYILMGLSASFGISNAFVMIFQCTPVSFFWTSWTGEYEGTCVQVKAYSWYKAALQILMDIAIIALPILPLTKLSMRKKKKVQVVLMFCTGFMYVTLLSPSTPPDPYHTDLTYSESPLSAACVSSRVSASPTPPTSPVSLSFPTWNYQDWI